MDRQEGYFQKNYNARWQYYEHYSGTVYRHAFSLTHDKAKSEELVTKVFQYAFERYAQAPCPDNSELLLLSQTDLIFSSMGDPTPEVESFMQEPTPPPAPMEPPAFLLTPDRQTQSMEHPMEHSAQPSQGAPAQGSSRAPSGKIDQVVYDTKLTEFWSPDMVDKAKKAMPSSTPYRPVEIEAQSTGGSIVESEAEEEEDEQEDEELTKRSIPMTIVNTCLFVLNVVAGFVIMYQLELFPRLF